MIRYTTQQQKMRAAFSMITAIFVMVIMASVGALVMGTSGKIVKSTTTQYQHEQAILYAKSYTELAIMAITANDRKTCLYDFRGDVGGDPAHGDGYRIRVYVSYIAPDALFPGYCATVRRLSNNVTTLSTPLTVILDATVYYRDPDNTSRWRTVHRRTVQKI